MSTCKSVLTLMLLTLISLALPRTAAWAQENENPGSTPPTGGTQQPGSEPVPAIGPDTQAAPATENPPISAIDQPGLEPHAAPLSYLQPGLHISESADSNVTDTLGNSSVHSITRALGSLELQRLWSHYDLALDYIGGVGYYSAGGLGVKNIQQFDIDQKINWKRGQLGVRDSFSYLPEGTFASSYGEGFGALGGTLGGPPPGFGPEALGTLGQVPRIMNLALADVTEYLSPKSSATAAVGYGLVHFTGNTGVQGVNFLGSTQFTVQGGFDRVVGPHDQVAIVYAYQQFDFSISGFAFHSNLVQGLWGHRISGRMDFLVGAGPQVTTTNFLGSTTTSVGAAARASLHYKFPKTMLSLVYERYNTEGSGFFAGAETDRATLGASRPLNRIWTITTDLGYSRNTRQTPLTLAQILSCEASSSANLCPGTIASRFDYGYAGVALHRMLGRNFHVYASYQFNELSFDPSFCGFSTSGASLSPCNRISQRHIGTIGLDWNPRPIRLD